MTDRSRLRRSQWKNHKPPIYYDHKFRSVEIAFSLENEYIEYVRMPVRIKKGSATLMKVMNTAFRDMQGEIV